MFVFFGCVSTLLVVGATDKVEVDAKSASWVTELTSDSLPYGFTSVAELMRVQDPLLHAATEIQSAVLADETTKSGFASVELDLSTRSVNLFWKGPVPTSVGVFLTEVESRNSVSITVLQAPFSKQEIDAEINVLANTLGLNLTLFGPQNGGNGIRVESEDPVAVTELLPVVLAAKSRLSSPPGFGPSVVAVQGKRRTLFSRHNDSAPWYGGNQIRGLNNGECSSGWSVMNGWPANNHFVMMAHHCAIVNNVPVKDCNLDAMGPSWGTTTWLAKERDVALADVTSAAGRIWLGATNGTEFSVAVKGFEGSFVGTVVGTSGGYSGERCCIRTDLVNQNWPGAYLPSFTINGVSIGHHTTSGQTAAGQGDSGGPVFTFVTGGVKANGQIIGGTVNSSLTCSGELNFHSSPFAARLCSNDLAFMPVSTALQNQGVYLITQ